MRFSAANKVVAYVSDPPQPQVRRLMVGAPPELQQGSHRMVLFAAAEGPDTGGSLDVNAPLKYAQDHPLTFDNDKPGFFESLFGSSAAKPARGQVAPGGGLGVSSGLGANSKVGVSSGLKTSSLPPSTRSNPGTGVARQAPAPNPPAPSSRVASNAPPTASPSRASVPQSVRTLILDVWEDRAEGYAEAEGFQFPLTLTRAERSHLLSPAERTAAAQSEAARIFPELAVEGTMLHQDFMARLHAYKAKNPSYFEEAEWPLRLARECVQAISER